MDSPSISSLARGLFPPVLPSSERGKLLWMCMHIRDTRAWITPGCYAWWRYTDDLKRAQGRLATYRRSSSILVDSNVNFTKSACSVLPEPGATVIVGTCQTKNA